MKVTIYGMSSCAGCEAAKLLCKTNSVDYDYKIVGQDIMKEQLSEMVGFPIRSVPQIFITNDGFSQYIGGFEQLSSFFKNGMM